MTEATAALAVHAPQFSGSLAITRTTFTRNAFSVPTSTPSRRSALQVRAAWDASFTGGLTHDRGDPWMLGGHAGDGSGATCSEGGSNACLADKLDRYATLQPLLDTASASGWWPHRQLQQAGCASTSEAGPADSLLSRARSIHPGLQVRPWAALGHVLVQLNGHPVEVLLSGDHGERNAGVALHGGIVAVEEAVRQRQELLCWEWSHSTARQRIPCADHAGWTLG